MGNAPCGFYKYRFPKLKSSSDDFIGAKVCYYCLNLNSRHIVFRYCCDSYIEQHGILFSTFDSGNYSLISAFKVQPYLAYFTLF